MAADIVPQLYEDILNSFNQGIKADKRIQKFYKRLEAGKATGNDVSKYAAYLGTCAANALSKNFTDEKLPEGKLYWNIAERTIKPLMREVHKMVMESAIRQQETEDEKTGIGMKPVKSEFQEERVDDLIDTILRYQEDEPDE